MVHYPVDDPVGSRGPGGDADPAVRFDIDLPQLFGGLDVEGGFSLEFRELRQPPGVGAVQAADDENGVRSGRERLDFGLSFRRGVADGIENEDRKSVV